MSTSPVTLGSSGDLPVIHTPDRRVRVFVSSTFQELAPERAAVRAAITRLRLTPVMFESAARAHAPRETAIARRTPRNARYPRSGFSVIRRIVTPEMLRIADGRPGWRRLLMS